MPRFAFVNHSYVPHRQAHVHVEDRGYQFADGVYEVISCIEGALADSRGHFDRLERSLRELGMPMPVPREILDHRIRELLRLNRLQSALVYIQVTRGVARREFSYPVPAPRQSLVITARPFRFDGLARMKTGVNVITVPDIRWKRRDIKSIALLPQAMAKQKAAEQGAYEAWMVDDHGFVTEGASSNAWIVTRDGVLVTRNAGSEILKGVTRTALLSLREGLQLRIEERAFTPQEAYEAAEAFMTAATALVIPIVSIDGRQIGDGRPGRITMQLYDEYRAYAAGERGGQIGWTA